MFGVSALIIFSLIATTTAPKGNTSSTVFPADFKKEPNIVLSADFKEEQIKSLKPITSNQALPVILFESQRENDHLTFPTGLKQAEINNEGRLASGTEFYASPTSKKGIYFCPISDFGVPMNCLTPVSFENSQVLECKGEPVPFITRKSQLKNCGPDGAGTPLVMFYRICPAVPPYTYRTGSMIMHTLCYDQSSNKILFVSYKAFMAKLLAENILTREREVKFEELRKAVDYSMDKNYYKILDTAVESHPNYQFQKMAHPEHFALAMWRKNTYHYANVALQHKELVVLWNQIMDYIRTHLIETYLYPRVIRTGVFDIPADHLPTTNEDGSVYNIWYTMVADLNQVNQEPFKGIVILMNNFFTKQTRLQNYIDGICGKEDFCVKNLTDEFDQVGGRVRCCRVNENISNFFRVNNDIIRIDEVLRINNISYMDEDEKMTTKNERISKL